MTHLEHARVWCNTAKKCKAEAELASKRAPKSALLFQQLGIFSYLIADSYLELDNKTNYNRE